MSREFTLSINSHQNILFRLQPHTSPVGVAVKGTHLVENEAYSEILSPPMVNPPTPGAPINSPIFPNLVQHNLGSSEHHAGLPESDIEGISVMVCNNSILVGKNAAKLGRWRSSKVSNCNDNFPTQDLSSYKLVTK